MNSRIYYKDNFIAFSETPSQPPADQLISRLQEIRNDQDRQQLVTLLLDEKAKRHIYFPPTAFEQVFSELKKSFKYIEAAGGFIEKENQFLCIHRLGRWDLPKGKLEKKEKREDAAIRECEEECGITQLTIVRQLSSTFHVYPHKKGHAIKQTFWYYMRSTDNTPLKAQTEENIDEARWFTEKEMEEIVLKDTYYTITDVVNEGLSFYTSLKNS